MHDGTTVFLDLVPALQSPELEKSRSAIRKWTADIASLLDYSTVSGSLFSQAPDIVRSN